MFALLRNKKTDREQVENLYAELVKFSRQPELFDEYNVPDTVDGRFEMICLHASLFIICFNNLEDHKFSQMFFDRMFVEMDRACREMGIGDLSVPKHIKKMMVAFNGRLQKYKDALEADDIEVIASSLHKNVFNSLEDGIDHEKLKKMAIYLQTNYKTLSECDVDELRNADMHLSPIVEMVS